MDTNTLLIALGAAVVAGIVGFKIATYIQVQAFSQILNDLGITPDRLVKLHQQMDQEDVPEDMKGLAGKSVVDGKVEQVGQSLYVYNLNTGEFIAQGNSQEELTEALATKLDTLIIRISPENGGHLLKANTNV
jgi:hypothetical protein